MVASEKSTPAEDAIKDGLDRALLKRFDVLKCCGRGAYGVVWKVFEKETGRVLALKRCFDAFQNSTDAQRTFREIVLLQALNGHENIVRLMNVFKAENHQDLFVVFDYMESDLQHVIAASMLQPIHVEYIMYQILKALKYVHSGGVLHRDLKPSNVLLSANCHVRLCDFGLARTATAVVIGGARGDEKQTPSVFTDYVATRWYRAPELLLGASMYGEGVDMWSVGCILGEMISGKPIFRGRSTMDQVEKIIELTGKPSEHDMRPISSTAPYAKTMLQSVSTRQMPSTGVLFLMKAPAEAKSLILKCLKFNPDKRPSAEMTLEDPFVQKFYRQEAEPTCDKVIRMPIPDDSKMKATDYRNQIYNLIALRKQMARDEAGGPQSRSSSKETPKSPRMTGRKTSPRTSRSTRRSNNQTTDRDAVAWVPWTLEGGAAAPPTTPR